MPKLYMRRIRYGKRFVALETDRYAVIVKDEYLWTIGYKVKWLTEIKMGNIMASFSMCINRGCRFTPPELCQV
jgi:hypothetical protein